MGRLLVNYPLQGFLDVLRRVLPSRFEVESFEHYQLAENHLAAGGAYEAVLCGLADPAWAIKIFEKAAACSTHTRLIPIASDFTQLDGFRDQWNSSRERQEKYGSIGQEWLREHFTEGDIHALFPPHGQLHSPDAVTKPTVTNHPAFARMDSALEEMSLDSRLVAITCPIRPAAGGGYLPAPR